MLSDSMVTSLYSEFDKFTSKKDGHIVHAILWNGTKKMFYSTDLNKLDYACLMDRGASKMMGDVPTKDGQYCLSFNNTSIDDDCDEFSWMKFSVEQFAEANQAYIVIGTKGLDDHDPLVIPKKRFEKVFKPVVSNPKYMSFDNAMEVVESGYSVSEPTLNGKILEAHHLSFIDKAGNQHKIAPHIIMIDNNYHYTHIIDKLDLPFYSKKWYAVK